MKAFLLAAGLGTRLRPITNTIPKCMVPICGRPLLFWWFQLFEKYGINEVLVNTHYLSQIVREYIQLYMENNKKLRIIEFYETNLLGSAGTVRANFNFIEDEEDFFVCYADNLTDINLCEMLLYHKKNNSRLTVALFHTNKPEQCGIATLNENNLIIDFEEKPIMPKSNLANAGVYIVQNKIVPRLPEREILDFGKDILPTFIGKMYGWKTDNYLLDIGTLDNYKKAQKEWENHI